MNIPFIKPQWSPLTIALMVAGFIIFWPLGLLVLGYILWGEKFGGSMEKAQAFWGKGKPEYRSGKRHQSRRNYATETGNSAFDDYRTGQLRRIEEEYARLDAEMEDFHAYMDNLRKARDREEFDRFMNERNVTGRVMPSTEMASTIPTPDPLQR